MVHALTPRGKMMGRTGIHGIRRKEKEIKGT
jgi:hypothetical protein